MLCNYLLAFRSTILFILNMPRAVNKKAVVWHPLVHQRYEEELYFFLISVKPFEQIKILDNLKKVAAHFGVEKFCAYRIFGQYDILLRIWLPSARGPQFYERAQEEIINVQAITPFHVTSISDPWRFRSQNMELTIKQLSTLTPPIIKDIQGGKADPKVKQNLVDAGLLAEVDDYRKTKKNAIKAFVAVSEPKWPDYKKRQKMFQQITHLVEDDNRLQKVTIYSGLGFSWLLIKAVTEEFYAFGQLIEKIAEDFSEDGVSTNTFMAATDAYVEGECISLASLDAKDGDESVRLFLPELYASDIAAPMRDEIEEFVRRKILKDGLGTNDQLAFQKYFKAVLSNNSIEVLTTLYPKFVEAEQDLRAALIGYATKHGAVEKLVSELDPKKEYIKSMWTIPMAYSMRGCRMVLLKENPGDEWLSKLAENTFDQLASFRNKIMHGAGFRRDHDWKSFAQAALDLMKIKEKFLQMFNGLASTPNKPLE
jgi:hypothetical protein